MAHIVQILNRLAWSELFSLSLYTCISFVMRGGAFFWPIAFSRLCCDTQARMRLHREAPEISLRLKEFRLIMHINRRTINSTSVYAVTPNQQPELLSNCHMTFWSLLSRYGNEQNVYFCKRSRRKCTAIFDNTCEKVDQKANKDCQFFANISLFSRNSNLKVGPNAKADYCRNGKKLVVVKS